MDYKPNTRRRGLLLAVGTAVISGVAIFLNGYAVRAWSAVTDATGYTTVKNLVAGLAIGIFGLALARGRARQRPALPHHPGDRLLLGVVALVGGSVPFVLFFEGLAQSGSGQAALIHKSLLVWVALLAVVFLRERIGWAHVAAIGLLVWGQSLITGGVGSMTFGKGETMILAATFLWSIEVVVAKRLLADIPFSTVANARMLGGAVVLVAWSVVRGGAIEWTALSVTHLLWMAAAGVLLSGYVLTWFAALSMAPAVDVTAVLVGGALITALLQTTIQGAPMPDVSGVVLVGAGVALAGMVGWRRISAGTT